MSHWSTDQHLARQASIHAALSEPARLAIVDDLWLSDRSPRELSERLGIPSNLLAHHLDALEAVGLVSRHASAGDARRKYVGLVTRDMTGYRPRSSATRSRMFFLCTHNSARSQLAAALWTARTGRPATSAGTSPASRVHRGAVAAARRVGIPLTDARPTAFDSVPRNAQVVTVCDLVHEHLDRQPDWWHWSIPDPSGSDDPHAFDDVVAEIQRRIDRIEHSGNQRTGERR